MRHWPDGTSLTLHFAPEVACIRDEFFSWQPAGDLLQKMHAPSRRGSGGEGQHADARRDRLLLERARVEAVHRCAGMEPQH